jgi:hypothetical protein
MSHPETRGVIGSGRVGRRHPQTAQALFGQPGCGLDASRCCCWKGAQPARVQRASVAVPRIDRVQGRDLFAGRAPCRLPRGGVPGLSPLTGVVFIVVHQCPWGVYMRCEPRCWTTQQWDALAGSALRGLGLVLRSARSGPADGRDREPRPPGVGVPSTGERSCVGSARRNGSHVPDYLRRTPRMNWTRHLRADARAPAAAHQNWSSRCLDLGPLGVRRDGRARMRCLNGW